MPDGTGLSATPTNSLSDSRVSAAVVAAMEAARNIKMGGIVRYFSKLMSAAHKKKTWSLLMSAAVTKKTYLPQQKHDIDYRAIFNGPACSTLEADTHTSITIGGSDVYFISLHHG